MLYSIPAHCFPRITLFKGRDSRFSACAWIKILFSDFLLILSVKNPTHIYFSNQMTEIYRTYQWITPTLLTLNLVLTRRFYSAVDEPTAICMLISRVAVWANSCEIIKRETFTSKFHTRAIYLILIGSLTMQLIVSWTCAESWSPPFKHITDRWALRAGAAWWGVYH